MTIDRNPWRFTRKNVTIVLSASGILVAIITGAMKCADAIDYFVDRSKPIQEIREKAIKQEGKIDGLYTKLDDVKQDTKTILRELRRH